MNIHHKEMLRSIKRSRRDPTGLHHNNSYTGSNHYYYYVSNPVRRGIVKEWLKNYKEISDDELLALLDNLLKGESHEEKTMACMILGYLPRRRHIATTKHLNKWLSHLVGWAEVDSLCQNIFTYEEMLKDWGKWKAFILKLSKSRNINKRRASLVFLTGPVLYTNDEKIKNLAFLLIDRLKNEKSILITKAISWLLRSMVYQHKKEVSRYIANNMGTLPKIAIRETLNKIKTGKK